MSSLPDKKSAALAALKEVEDAIFECTGTAFMAGESTAKASDRQVIYRKLCEAGNKVAWVHGELYDAAAPSAIGAPAWISTAPGNPLPKDGESVLIWYRQAPDGWRVYIGRYLYFLKQWRPEGGNGDFGEDITHWMPLPSAPTDGSTDKCKYNRRDGCCCEVCRPDL